MEFAEYALMEEWQKSHWWYRGRRAIVSGCIKVCFKAGDTRAILDVGCGVGEAAKLFPDPSVLVGIDDSEEALHLAKGKGYRELHRGTGSDLPFQDRSFQSLLMLDVLEHIENDRKALSECNRVLVRGGTMLLTVPAYQWLWSGHDEVFGHKRRYARNDLRRKMEEAGFEIRFMSHYITLLFPAVAIVRFIRRLTGSKAISTFVPYPKFINELLYGLVVLEGYMLRMRIALPFGSSIIAIAKKH